MSDKKQPEKSPKSAKPKKVLTEEEKAEKGRQALVRYMSWVMPLQAKGRHAFRGQADAGWGVTSGAYRRLEKEMRESPYAAQSLFVGYLHERINEAHMRFSEHGEKHPLEVMAHLQHYGAATGLIDFTESAQTALLFACKDVQDKPGKVFVVRLDDPQKIQEIKTPQGIAGKLDEFFPTEEMPEKLRAWRPGDSNYRMVAQQSLFLFGRPKIEEVFFAEVPFEVAAEEKIPLMNILESMGISENFMFLDFVGFALANAHGKVYDLHRTKTYYDEKIGDPQTPTEKKEKWSLYFARGNLNHALKRYQEAREDFTSVIDVAPSVVSSVGAYFNRGIALRQLGRYAETLADYTRVIELDPQYVMAYNNRGIILRKSGRYEEALADYTRAIEINPQNARAYNNRGIVLEDLRRYEEALADYTRAIDLNPQYAKAYHNRGKAYHNLNRHKEAASDWNEAIRTGEQMGDEKAIQAATEALAKHAKPK